MNDRFNSIVNEVIYSKWAKNREDSSKNVFFIKLQDVFKARVFHHQAIQVKVHKVIFTNSLVWCIWCAFRITFNFKLYCTDNNVGGDFPKDLIGKCENWRRLLSFGRIFSFWHLHRNDRFFFIYLFLKISKQAHLLNAMQFFNFCHFAYCTNDDRQIINERWKVTNNQAFSVGLAWLFQKKLHPMQNMAFKRICFCVQVCIGFGWSCRFKISHSDHNENMALKLKSCHLRTFSRCKTPQILALNYISPPNTHKHTKEETSKKWE